MNFNYPDDNFFIFLIVQIVAYGNIRIHISYTYNNTTAVEEKHNTNTHLKNGLVLA